MKTCARCDQTKALDDFNKSSRGAHGRQRYCRDCQSKHYQDNDKLYKEQTRIAKRYRVGASYGLSKEETDAFYKRNGGVCELCNLRPGKNLDHDHATNKPRGLLCMQYNTALGKLGDTLEGVMKAVTYLSQ